MNLPERDGEYVEVVAYLDEFARLRRPEGMPMPAIYFDPEVTRAGTKRTTLRAKCVVVDDRCPAHRAAEHGRSPPDAREALALFVGLRREAADVVDPRLVGIQARVRPQSEMVRCAADASHSEVYYLH